MRTMWLAGMLLGCADGDAGWAPEAPPYTVTEDLAMGVNDELPPLRGEPDCVWEGNRHRARTHEGWGRCTFVYEDPVRLPFDALSFTLRAWVEVAPTGCASARFIGGLDERATLDRPLSEGSHVVEQTLFGALPTEGKAWVELAVHSGCAPTTAWVERLELEVERGPDR